MKRFGSWVSAGVALLLGAGCSSSQMSRIDRNRDVYETWPIEVRQAVLDGKVEPGMNADMVRVAWGEPSEVSVSPAGDEIWVRGRDDAAYRRFTAAEEAALHDSFIRYERERFWDL